MPQLFEFIVRHWMLCAALVLLVILLLVEELKNKRGGNRLSPQTMTHLINRERAVVIDLRAKDAFNQGHIVNAINIPQAELLNNPDKIKKYQDKPVILICDLGQGSTTVAPQLRKKGYNKVFILAGGLQAWKNAGLPLESK
jgi:rhodanese-related sulfurtransferase